MTEANPITYSVSEKKLSRLRELAYKKHIPVNVADLCDTDAGYTDLLKSVITMQRIALNDIVHAIDEIRKREVVAEQ